jgi:hypothetical protein
MKNNRGKQDDVKKIQVRESFLRFMNLQIDELDKDGEEDYDVDEEEFDEEEFDDDEFDDYDYDYDYDYDFYIDDEIAKSYDKLDKTMSLVLKIIVVIGIIFFLLKMFNNNRVNNELYQNQIEMLQKTIEEQAQIIYVQNKLLEEYGLIFNLNEIIEEYNAMFNGGGYPDDILENSSSKIDIL